ncbi:hypothetical protein KY285_013067 [Solanum tuberosum]|nr:hypothetical protein KY289_013716 [Solanum tuberosum]KAH0717036.1 hypothetical protein KY285_013067 [Solanum tuberosum]
MFIFTSEAITMYILVNVDDILITGNYPTLVAHVINSLTNRFSLKNLGELNYFWGSKSNMFRMGLSYHSPDTYRRFSQIWIWLTVKELRHPCALVHHPKQAMVHLLPMQPCIDALLLTN